MWNSHEAVTFLLKCSPSRLTIFTFKTKTSVEEWDVRAHLSIRWYTTLRNSLARDIKFCHQLSWHFLPVQLASAVYRVAKMLQTAKAIDEIAAVGQVTTLYTSPNGNWTLPDYIITLNALAELCCSGRFFQLGNFGLSLSVIQGRGSPKVQQLI